MYVIINAYAIKQEKVYRMTKKQKMKRKRILQRIMPVIIAVILIVIVLLVSFGNGIFEEYGKSQKKADMNAYF